jgi:cell division protein FtsW
MSATAPSNRRISTSERPPGDHAAVEEQPVVESKEDARAADRAMYRGPIDVPLLAVTLLLVSFGIVMVYSASAVFAARSHGSAQYYLMRQASFAIVGITGMTVASRIDYRIFRKLTYPMLGGTVFLLMLVIAGFGRAGGGAARWLKVGPVTLQPAELAKVVIILWLAHSLSKKQEKIKTFSVGFLPHLLMTGFLILCLKQPDFGSSMVLLLLTFGLMFVAGAKSGYILGAIVAALPVAHHLVMGTAYRRRRWEAFVDPWAHRHDISYQLVESLLGFGAGGTTGLGLGDSRQKLFFLPEAHTDFISAIVGEELGFVGMIALLCGYTFLLYFARGTTTGPTWPSGSACSSRSRCSSTSASRWGCFRRRDSRSRWCRTEARPS